MQGHGGKDFLWMDEASPEFLLEGFTVMILAGGTGTSPKGRTMSVDGKRVLIIVGDDYEDLELWYPKLRLIEAGVHVVVAGQQGDKVYRGKNGYPCKSDAALNDMDSSDFDIERIERCCYHNASPRGIVSFCAMNNLTRQEPVAESAFVAPARSA